MSTNHTPNYNLSQWVRTDKVQMDDFNADNAKLDAALAGKASAAEVDALQSAVSSLQSSVSSKASQSTVNSLSSTVSSLSSSLAGKGNCQIYTTTYTGNDTAGEANAISITFPAQPIAVYVGSFGRSLVLLRGQTSAYSFTNMGASDIVTVAWNGRTVKWYAKGATAHMNQSSFTYAVVALIPAS